MVLNGDVVSTGDIVNAGEIRFDNQTTPDAALSRAVAKGDSPVTFHKLTTSNLTGQGGTINMRVRLDGRNGSTGNTAVVIVTEMTALNAETDAVIFTVYTGLMAAGACQNPVIVHCAGTVRDDAGSLGGYLNLVHTSSGLWADIVAQGTRHSMKASSDNNDFRARGWGWLGSLETGLPFSITDNLMLEPQLQYTWQGLSLDDGQDNAGYVKFGHGSAQHVRAGFRLGSHNDMSFGEGTSSRDTLRDSAKHRVSELPVNWWVQPSVIRTFSSRGDMSMGTAAAGSNMTFSPSRNGTSLDLQAGLEARVRENITLGVQAGHRIQNSSTASATDLQHYG